MLYLKIKNTSAIALRAAFVHGPYTLYVAAYPKDFDPNTRWEQPRERGVPEFEPNLKAGGSWTTGLKVPENVRSGAGRGSGDPNGGEGDSFSWIIEVSSQIIFSNSAAVHYEILLGRDEKSLSLGGMGGNTLLGGPSTGAGTTPGQVSDHQQSQGAKEGRHNAQPKGVYSRAIQLSVDDTASLWNRPKMPEWENMAGQEGAGEETGDAPVERTQGDSKIGGAEEDKERGAKTKKGPKRKRKKVHLVVLTHGLHGNLGSDMLFLKESIDAAARQARLDRKKWKESRRNSEEGKADAEDDASSKDKGKNQKNAEESAEDDEEEIIVRGFSGNAVRTERGIKYLGKRLAKYILTMTYPDQPYKPVTKKSATETFSHALRPELQKLPADPGTPTHKDSTILKHSHLDTDNLAYKITSVSFVAHSLGGLVQTYAVAYIQKHSPTFFDHIKPINFIALASPFLGLSNENPLYVKFALDFGLVGRTGQDLGLTWRAPTLARSGWGAIVGGIGESAHKKLEGDAPPESKPLLRILPTGPAHVVLKKFKNRTIYSNVVNDGVVPLRTSCLLFLDWQGLGRVEKARRENGLVGTVLEWGWAEVTGANSSSPDRRQVPWSDTDGADDNEPTRQGHGEDVPQPSSDAVDKDNVQNLEVPSVPSEGRSSIESGTTSSVNTSPTTNNNPLASLMSFFKPTPSPTSHEPSSKSSRIYKRSQTLKFGDETTPTSSTPVSSSPPNHEQIPAEERGRPPQQEGVPRLSAPPRTSFFEAAGDLLKPPIPPTDFLIDPSSRAQTIFHDRVYHPEDIPPPPLKKRSTSALIRKSKPPPSQPVSSPSSSNASPGISPSDTGLSSRDYDDTTNTGPPKPSHETIDGSAMKVEEKIARAYHRDLSWRKVLVRLEPDAHNNMIVRRMFANAYGWPVVRHLCSVHFGFDPQVDDDLNVSKAPAPASAGLGLGVNDERSGRNVSNPTTTTSDKAGRTRSESREALDVVPALHSAPHPSSLGKALRNRPSFDRVDSVEGGGDGWSERAWAWGDSEGDGDDSEDEEDGMGCDGNGNGKMGGGGGWTWTEKITGRRSPNPQGTSRDEVEEFLGLPRGLRDGERGGGVGGGGDGDGVDERDGDREEGREEQAGKENKDDGFGDGDGDGEELKREMSESQVQLERDAAAARVLSE